MAIRIRFLKQHELIVASVSGPVYLEDVLETISQATSDPEFVWNHDRIIFLNKDVEFSDLDVKRLTEIINAMKDAYLAGKDLSASGHPAYRYAVVSNSTINKVMMSLFGAVLEDDPVSQSAIEKFETVSEALGWLGRETIPEHEFHDEMQDV